MGRSVSRWAFEVDDKRMETIVNGFICVIAIVALGLGARSSEGLAQEPSSVVETYGAWTVQCKQVRNKKKGKSRKTCQMSQEIKQKRTGTRIIMLAISSVDESKFKITIISPFGLLLSEGIKLTLDKEELMSINFKTCLPIGCFSELQLANEQLRPVRSSKTLGVHTVGFNGQKLLTNLSLKGFDAAIKRLQSPM